MFKTINNQKFSIKQYEDQNKEEWDNFVDSSKNGTFLHKINYFHYHINKFNDCSLIIKKNDQVVAVMPGNIENGIFYTHRGLTYGGLITQNETKVEDVITYFTLINDFLVYKEINKVIYKAIPHIYSSIPAEEDEYVLFRLGARLISSSISSVICMDKRLKFSSTRMRNIKKTQQYNLEVKTDFSYNDFWIILTNNLLKSHNVTPVHSLAEIKNLKTKFAENIKLYCVYKADECIAGVVMYITDHVAHVQYISSNEIGRKIAALDFLFDHLINVVFSEIKYFDFGTSVEEHGHYLNEGLIFQKQGFGGRGILYQQFEYDVKNTIHNKKEN